MLVKELIAQLHTLPQDAQLKVAFGFKVNSVVEDVARTIDRISYNEKANSVHLETNSAVQLFY
jgi:hypothetical protein